VDAPRAPLLFVSQSYNLNHGAPLVVSLHGAGGEPRRGIDLLHGDAKKEGFLIVAPASRRQTSEVIVEGFGPDVLALQLALNGHSTATEW
jgi:phospholipase/carboxylesterase